MSLSRHSPRDSDKTRRSSLSRARTTPNQEPEEHVAGPRGGISSCSQTVLPPLAKSISCKNFVTRRGKHPQFLCLTEDPDAARISAVQGSRQCAVSPGADYSVQGSTIHSISSGLKLPIIGRKKQILPPLGDLMVAERVDSYKSLP